MKLRTRQFKTKKELISLTNDYFASEKFIMIETYYKYIGVYKQEVYNWKNEKEYPNKKYREWLEVVNKAKEEIHLYLERVLLHGKTASELDHNKVIKSRDGGKFTYDFTKPDPKVLLNYLRSRFKDNWEEDSNDTQSRVTINLVNEGNNAIK